MKALTFGGVRDVRYQQVDEPTLRAPGDAVVRVDLAAICGSDLHVYHGRETGLDAATVMGHEFIGHVAATGKAVTRFTEGDRVVAPFTTSCGSCFFCRSGLSARCPSGQLFGWVQQGVGLQGGQAEYVRVPLADSTLVSIDEDLSAEAALLLADVLPTGWHCSSRAVTPGAVAVVLGCGPVGLAAVAAAIEQGAGRVLAVDSVPDRLALAERYGATPVLLGRDDIPAAVGDTTEGRGADAVLEAVGTSDAARLALDLVRPGGVVSIVGVHHEDRFPFSPLEAYDRNLTIHIGRCPARSLMEGLIPWAHRRPDLAAIVTHRRSLADGAEAYRLFDLKRDGCVKIALEP
jgi:threonine dehydrogenase-like Zn-dependent dehydrogenase